MYLVILQIADEMDGFMSVLSIQMSFGDLDYISKLSPKTGLSISN